MEPKIYWGGILRALRLKNNLTQKEVAAVLHISRQGYSYIETGRCNPSAEIITVLSNVYSVDLNSYINSCFSNEYLREQDQFMSSLSVARNNQRPIKKQPARVMPVDGGVSTTKKASSSRNTSTTKDTAASKSTSTTMNSSTTKDISTPKGNSSTMDTSASKGTFDSDKPRRVLKRKKKD